MKRPVDLPIRVVRTEAGAAEATVRLDPEFAGFAGHFPGAPVLPGMCHVDLAVRAASAAFGETFDLVAIERARFVRKVLPGEELTIRLTSRRDAAGTHVAADHSVGGEPAADLRLVLAPRSV